MSMWNLLFNMSLMLLLLLLLLIFDVLFLLPVVVMVLVCVYSVRLDTKRGQTTPFTINFYACLNLIQCDPFK